MDYRFGHFIRFALGVVLIGGCAKEPATPTVREASASPYVRDLPLPAGFRLDERRSEEKVTAGSRFVKHVYEGNDGLQAVKNFYQHYMPQSNWELTKQSLDKGVYLLNYRKGPEVCEIRIERMPSGIFDAVTQVRATIQPSDMETSARMPTEE
ncbi:MAG: hypothetical protein JXQ75_11185 [Phycisphaerae bacterium]|nr:hypothetical protein [Phycisphaerae bacterium]